MVLFLLVLSLNMKLVLWIWNQKMLLLMPGMGLLRLMILQRILEAIPIKHRTPQEIIIGLKKIYGEA